MPTATAILGDPEIERFIEKHQDAAEPIRRAVRQLGAKRDGLAAVKKLLPALSQDKIFVFFSYNNKDEEAATEVVQALRSQAANKLQITYQAEFTERIAGKKWRDEIREAIRPANWFVLLLPDPSDERDWCLFETGLFVANRCSADSLICLHHPDTRIPSQIGDYHAVSATLPEVEKFLRMVYVRKDPCPACRRSTRTSKTCCRWPSGSWTPSVHRRTCRCARPSSRGSSSSSIGPRSSRARKTSTPPSSSK